MDIDTELVARAREGSQEAFADLVERYQSRVFNLARAVGGREADADDLAQEIFLKVYRGLPGFRGDSTFRTWLYRVAINVIRTHRRGRSILERLGFSSRSGRPDEEDVMEQLPAPGNLEVEALHRDAIDKALAQLSPDLREAVTLRDIEGLEYREMAAVLDLPIGTVMSRISRGRQRLRPLLAPLMGATRGMTEHRGGTA